MRGADGRQGGMFSYVSPERRIPADHPFRPIRAMTDEVLRQLSPRLARLYPKTGWPSVAPEKLLRALLVQVLYSIRSEAAAHGAARVQSPLPLVRWLEHG